MSIYNTIPHDNRFIANKYTRWYFSIIDNALSQNRKKSKEEYFEAHHILPKSMFKDFICFKSHKWNKVLLTAREHFLVHILLPKMTTGFDNIKMSYAFYYMSKIKEVTLTSKLYSKSCESARTANSELKIGENNHFYGRKHTKESRAKMSEKQKGINHVFYGKKRPQETLDKMSQKQRKEFVVVTPNNETINIIGLGHFARQHGLSPEGMRSPSGSRKYKAYTIEEWAKKKGA